MDITEKSLQPVLDEIGLKNSDGTARTVRDLSQAEKQIVRYLSVLKQSAEAHGDWANTIESPSNQLKIFNNQLVEAQRAFANLFIGTFGQILPYANAILMVIKEVSNAIATMFGIEISDYNTGIADMSDAFVDVSDSIDDATGSVKKLKRETLGFDQINNINEDTGSGSKLSGGIDQKLLDAIKSYDNGMESVRMKALDIRDRIMEWLGFTKEIDPLTGKVSFKFADANSTLCKIVVTLKNIITNGGKVISGVLEVLKKDFDNGIFGKAIVLALESVNNVLDFIGKNKSAQKTIARILELLIGIKTLKLIPGGKQISSLIDGLSKKTSNWSTLLSSLSGHIKVYTNLAGKEGLTATKKLTAGIVEGTKAWGNNLSVMDRWKVGITGVVGGLASLSGISMAMEDISTSGLNMANSLGLVASSLGSITSGAMIGTSILPGWGTALGACVGGISSLVTAMKGYKSESDLALESAKNRANEAEKYLESLQAEYDQIEKNCQANLNMVDTHQSLANELKTLVDENGNVKKGYEDRVNFILGELNKAYGTEYKLVDGQIQKYNELVNSIDVLIAKKRLQIVMDSKEEAYTKAIKDQQTNLDELSKSQDTYNSSKKKLREIEQELSAVREEQANKIERLNELNSTSMLLTREERNEKIQLEQDIKSLSTEIGNLGSEQRKQSELTETNRTTMETWKESVGKNTLAIIEYEELMAASSSNNLEKINEAYKKSAEDINDSYEKRLTNAINYYDSYLEKQMERNGQITEEDKIAAQARLNVVLQSMKDQSKTIEGLTPEIVQKWITLATLSEDGFMSAFSQLNPDIQTQIISKMRSQGFSISSELQSGINQLNPTVTVDANISKINEKVQQAISTFNKLTFNFGNIFKADGGVYSNGRWSPITQYANGGLPPIGQMFIARERGPELVGKIGSHTAVMNNNQIVESVKAGVYEAVVMAMGGIGSTSVDINVHAEEGIIVEKAVRGIQQHVNQTGELPFTVPV